MVCADPEPDREERDELLLSPLGPLFRLIDGEGIEWQVAQAEPTLRGKPLGARFITLVRLDDGELWARVEPWAWHSDRESAFYVRLGSCREFELGKRP